VSGVVGRLVENRKNGVDGFDTCEGTGYARSWRNFARRHARFEMLPDTLQHPIRNQGSHGDRRIRDEGRMDKCRKSSDEFVHFFFVYIVEQPLQSKIVEASRSSFCVSKQLSRSVILKGSGKDGTKGNARGTLHCPHRQSEGQSQEDDAWAQGSGEGSLVRGAADDERKDAEDKIRREKDNEAASGSESNGIIDGPKELTDREEKKEDGNVKEDRKALNHPSHLKLRQALKEIRAHAATLLWRGAELGILQVLSRPLLDQRGHERARQSEEETYEHEDVDADGHFGGLELRANRGDSRVGYRGAAIRLGKGNQLSQECYCGTTIIGQEHLVRLDDEGRNDGREQTGLSGRRSTTLILAILV
jgi:hypothetical protein